MEKQLLESEEREIPYSRYFQNLLKSSSPTIKDVINNMCVSYGKDTVSRDGDRKRDLYASFLAEGKQLIAEFRDNKITLSGDLL